MLASISGTWFPVNSCFFHAVGQFVPSYCLVQAAHVPTNGRPWGTRGWVDVLVWTAVLAGAAGYAYRRDTGRI